MHLFGHCQLLCYSIANVVESSYGLDNLEEQTTQTLQWKTM